MPGAPPMTITSPKLPLCCACWRTDCSRATLSPLASHARGGTCAATSAMARSSNHTWPAWSRPWAVNTPGFRVSRHSVCVAITASSPSRVPWSASSPVGRSTASRAPACALSRRTASARAPSGPRVLPRPSRASMAKSACACEGSAVSMVTPASCARNSEAAASGGRREAVPTLVTLTRLPAWCRCSAASKPSPPLLPGPAAIQMRCACGASASASRARPWPALRIRPCGGQRAADCASTWREPVPSYSGQERS